MGAGAVQVRYAQNTQARNVFVKSATIPADPDEDWEIPVEDFKPGSEGTPVRFTEPGTYGYYCSIHGTANAGMIGSITVEG